MNFFTDFFVIFVTNDNLMSAESKDLSELLRNIQKGLRKYSIKELNEGLVKLLSKKNDNKFLTDKVLGIVAGEYSTTPDKLLHKNTRGALTDAKHTCYCILHYEYGMTGRQIAKSVFFNSHNVVAIGIRKFRNLDMKIKSDKEFMERYKNVKNKLELV